MRRLGAVVALAAAVTLVTGCYGVRGAVYVPAAPVVRAAADIAVTAAIVGTAIALSVPHDAHVHFEGCGCPRRWHDGRWVYWYGGWWEFYDPATGVWYHY